jgi:MFS family permease
MLSLIVFTILSSSGIPYFYAVFFGMGYAGMASLPPLIAADIFEGGTLGSIFGTLLAFGGAGAAIGAWFGGFLHDHLGSYILFFVIAIACAIFACLAVWFAAPRKIRIVPGKKVLRISRHITS